MIDEETEIHGIDIDIKLEDEKECESISVSMPDSSQMRPDMHGGDLGDQGDETPDIDEGVFGDMVGQIKVSEYKEKRNVESLRGSQRGQGSSFLGQSDLLDLNTKK